MAAAIALLHGAALKIGVLGFAGLWIVKAVAGVALMRWLRLRRARAR